MKTNAAPKGRDMDRDGPALLPPWEPPAFDGGEKALVCCCKLYTCVFAPCVVPSALRVIKDYEKGVRLRLGKRLHKGTLAGGMHMIFPSVDELLKIDIRERTLDVPRQNVVTREGLPITVDGVVYYQVVLAERALLSVQNVTLSIRMLAQTKLRETLGTKTFSEIQTEREAIAEKLQLDLDEATDPWGIKVSRVELTDLIIPENMKRAMGSEAEAAVNAKAKVIEAEGEVAASMALTKAAAEMEGNPVALQLRFLQTLTQISAEKNSTLVMPFPSSLLDGLSGLSKLAGVVPR